MAHPEAQTEGAGKLEDDLPLLGPVEVSMVVCRPAPPREHGHGKDGVNALSIS
ncbi:hypothetical protein D3C80_2143540 [compost metagenome]